MKWSWKYHTFHDMYVINWICHEISWRFHDIMKWSWNHSHANIVCFIHVSQNIDSLQNIIPHNNHSTFTHIPTYTQTATHKHTQTHNTCTYNSLMTVCVYDDDITGVPANVNHIPLRSMPTCGCNHLHTSYVQSDCVIMLNTHKPLSQPIKSSCSHSVSISIICHTPIWKQTYSLNGWAAPSNHWHALPQQPTCIHYDQPLVQCCFCALSHMRHYFAECCVKPPIQLYS